MKRSNHHQTVDWRQCRRGRRQRVHIIISSFDRCLLLYPHPACTVAVIHQQTMTVRTLRLRVAEKMRLCGGNWRSQLVHRARSQCNREQTDRLETRRSDINITHTSICISIANTSGTSQSKRRQPLSAVLHSLNELREFSRRHCHDGSTINVVLSTAITILC